MPDETSVRPRVRHMWLVQAVEYGIGVCVALTVPRSPDAPVVAGVALALVGIATFVDAPLSAYRCLSPRTHRVLGMVVSVGVLGLAAVLPLALSTRTTFLVAGVVQGFVSVRFGNGLRTSGTRPQ